MGYVLEEGTLTKQQIERKASAIQLEALCDTAKFELICIESIKQKNKRIHRLSRAINDINSAAEASNMSEEELKNTLFVTEDQKRAQAGKLVDVIKKIVSELDTDEESCF